MIAGVIDLAFADFSVAIPQMQGGTLRGIGVTSPKRNELTPDLPPLADAMPGFEVHDLVWIAGAGEYARADREQALHGNRKVPVDAGDPRKAGKHRHGGFADASG